MTPEQQTPLQSFRLTVSPKTTVGIDSSILIELERATARLVARNKFVCEFDAIVLFPLVADPEIFAAPEYVHYKRKENAVFVSQRISFETWCRARRPGRIRMATNNFSASINAIASRRLSEQSKAQLTSIIHLAAAELLANS